MSTGNFSVFKTWLKQISFLTDEDCQLFEPHLETKILKAKDFFLTEGKICKEIGFVNHGAFRRFYLSEGKEINMQFVFEQEFVVDYDSFLDGKPTKYFIQAIEDTEIVIFNLNALHHAYQISHSWERFGRMMAEVSFKITTERVESFLFMNGEQRYLNLLKKQPEIFERFPLYHIASYLGLERESLSRLRNKIAKR